MFLISNAYEVQSYRIKGPAWLISEQYDLDAILPDGTMARQTPQMLRNLLAERLKLSVHREKVESSVYALTVSSTGLALKPSDPDAPRDPPCHSLVRWS